MTAPRCICQIDKLELAPRRHRDVEHQLQGHRAAADEVLERLPLEQLHDDELTTVALADVVDGADVPMIERRRQSRFAPEPIERLRIRGRRRPCRRRRAFPAHDNARPVVPIMPAVLAGC